MCAAKTHLPVLGVPVQSSMLSGVDSLLSIVQMPAGVPVATLAIGKAGAINAALLSASILGGRHPQYHQALQDFRSRQTDTVLDNPESRQACGTIIKLGIIGGGQIGRMQALAGTPLGQQFAFLDPAPDACAAALGEHLCAAYDDREHLRLL